MWSLKAHTLWKGMVKKMIIKGAQHSNYHLIQGQEQEKEESSEYEGLSSNDENKKMVLFVCRFRKLMKKNEYGTRTKSSSKKKGIQKVLQLWYIIVECPRNDEERKKTRTRNIRRWQSRRFKRDMHIVFNRTLMLHQAIVMMIMMTRMIQRRKHL